MKALLLLFLAASACADLTETIRNTVTASNVDEPASSLALAQYQFARETGYDTKSEFRDWLMSNRDALEEYLSIGAVLTLKPKRAHGLDGWREIWQAYPESRVPGLWRRLAAACAATFADAGAEVTPKERFEFFREMHKAGNLVPYFDKALPFELALAIHGNGFANDQFEWAQAVTPKDKKTDAGVGNYGHSLVAYRGDNYRGQSVQGPEYYDRKPWHVATFMEYGAVCGRISMMNMMVANAHGAPCFTVGQPGHCAYVWKSGKVWSGGNFVSGWMETWDAHQQPFWLSRHSANINLVSAAVEAPGFARAERLRRLAAAWRETDPAKAYEILTAATVADSFHYGAWRERIEAALAWEKAPANLWPTMATEVKAAFPKFPIAMTDLLGRFEAQRLLAGYSDADKVAYAAVVARSLVAVPAREQWDLVYPAWKPWFARQLAGLGVAEKSAAAVVEANLVVKPPKKGATVKKVNGDNVWEQIPAAKRPWVESLFAAVLPAVETDPALFKGVAAAWLSLVAQDDAANARAAGFFRQKLAAAQDLRALEMLADSVLNATRGSADARASLVAVIRKRAAAFKKPNPDAMDRLLGLLAKHDFRDANRIGAWNGDKSFEWDITPLLTRTVGDWALHLNFRYTDGAPIAVKDVRLFEADKEISADAHAETADATLRPALFTVRLPQPKPGAKYVVRAAATGGADSTGAVLFRAEPVATFNAADWTGIGGWGGKEIKAAPEITDGWHEMEFDATKHLTAPGTVFVMFKYSSYGSPRVANVRLLVDGLEVAADPHSCSPISGANTMYALNLPAFRTNAKITVRALFTRADGWGTVFVRKQVAEKKTAAGTKAERQP